MIKEFFLKQMLKAKGVPADQVDMVVQLVNKNPELFQKIAKEIEHKVKHEKKGEMQASMEVMRKYQSEIQKVMKT